MLICDKEDDDSGGGGGGGEAVLAEASGGAEAVFARGGAPPAAPIGPLTARDGGPLGGGGVPAELACGVPPCRDNRENLEIGVAKRIWRVHTFLLTHFFSSGS